MSFILLLTTCLLVSCVLTGFLRTYALKKNIIDVPNERSSHTHPTPRGGGVSFVITYLLVIVVFALIDIISLELAVPIFIAGLIVAVIGFLDDHKHVSAGIRLLCHFFCSALVVYASGSLPIISFLGYLVDFSYIGWMIAAISVVWILNLFNFMDGIDGIAGVEAVTSSLVMGGIIYFIFKDPNVSILHLALSASVLGFLIWNFPPAKIFMGDAGSGFLGLMLATLLLLSSQVSVLLLWCWLVMLGVFIVDATFTLLRRVKRGEKLHEAHCSHAYQFASREFGSHLPITLAVLFINLFWLAPITIFIALGKVDGLIGLIIAYLPLIVLALKYNAGKVESSSDEKVDAAS